MAIDVFYTFRHKKLRHPGLLATFWALLSVLSAPPTPVAAREEISGASAVAPTLSSHTLQYQVVVGGQNAGEMSLRESAEGELRVQESVMRLEFQRAGATQSISMTSRFVESATGEALEASSRQELGEIPVEVRYRFQGGKIHIESRQGEAVVFREVDDPGGWLAPAASQALIERETARILAAGQGQFSLASIDPSLGPEKVTTDWTLEAADDTVQLGSRVVKASRWRQTQSFAPGIASIVHLSAEGDLLQSRTQLAGMEMVIVLREAPAGSADSGSASAPSLATDPASARPRAANLGPAPEMLTRTFIRPDRPLKRPRAQRRVEYSLRSRHPLTLPSVGYQRVEEREGDVRVVVDLDRPVVEQGAELGAELGKPELELYLGASIYLNHENPKVRELSTRALGAADSRARRAKNPAQRAETLRRFVNDYLERKDLRTILATASEVAVKASGDCTEHAVLLAALLRGDGIPARVAFGLIYVDEFVGARQIFGYHLWTQAYLDGHWVDLDATLAQSFDAAHLTLGTSGLDDPMSALALMTGALETFSNIEISIVAPP